MPNIPGNYREMVIVHPDADFLEDIAGKLREVLLFAYSDGCKALCLMSYG